MGKGRIVAAHGEGRYTLEVVEDRARAQSYRALAVQHVADLDSRISTLETALADAEQDVVAAAAAQDAAIEQYRQDMLEQGSSSVDLATPALAAQEVAGKRSVLRGRLQLLKGERLALQARIQRIDALPPLRQIEAWCADYTEDLGGDVATAEVPGEVGQVIIKPGFQNGAAWSASADGAIQPALSGTPASVFYNLASLPGWQKWRPTFRIATISNIDNDLCDITLDAAASSQQGLNVNAQGSYSGVPIMYMDCNGDAFEDGDRVLVAFSGNTEQPMVVGFEREPKVCAFGEFVFSAYDESPAKSQQITRYNGAYTVHANTSGPMCGGTRTTSVGNDEAVFFVHDPVSMWDSTPGNEPTQSFSFEHEVPSLPNLSVEPSSDNVFVSLRVFSQFSSATPSSHNITGTFSSTSDAFCNSISSSCSFAGRATIAHENSASLGWDGKITIFGREIPFSRVYSADRSNVRLSSVPACGHPTSGRLARIEWFLMGIGPRPEGQEPDTLTVGSISISVDDLDPDKAYSVDHGENNSYNSVNGLTPEVIVSINAGEAIVSFPFYRTGPTWYRRHKLVSFKIDRNEEAPIELVSTPVRHVSLFEQYGNKLKELPYDVERNIV